MTEEKEEKDTRKEGREYFSLLQATFCSFTLVFGFPGCTTLGFSADFLLICLLLLLINHPTASAGNNQTINGVNAISDLPGLYCCLQKSA